MAQIALIGRGLTPARIFPALAGAGHRFFPFSLAHAWRLKSRLTIPKVRLRGLRTMSSKEDIVLLSAAVLTAGRLLGSDQERSYPRAC